MCIRDSIESTPALAAQVPGADEAAQQRGRLEARFTQFFEPVSYTHLRAHETVLDLVCRLLLEKKKEIDNHTAVTHITSNNQVKQ